jgi:hypothetical protein
MRDPNGALVVRHSRSRWKFFGIRMQSSSVVSNGTKVREDETEVLAGFYCMDAMP